MALISFLNQKKAQAGVTLIELIIVIAIIAIVASVVVFNFGDFTSNVSLRNLAQQTALSIRKAQTYATSVKGINGKPPEYPAYGISFATNINGGAGATPGTKNFILFADKNGNRKYDRGVGDAPICSTDDSNPGECIESFTITTEDNIREICASGAREVIDTDGNTTYACTGETANVIEIVFVRPNPDARIFADGVSTEKSFATIILHSPVGRERVVTLYSTGQISTR